MIRFSKNWEKLGWIVFTTIRKNTGSKKIGQVHTIKTPNEIFKAKVIGLYPIKKAEITNDLASVDANMNRIDLVSMLEKWYGRDFDDFILITLWAGGKRCEK